MSYPMNIRRSLIWALPLALIAALIAGRPLAGEDGARETVAPQARIAANANEMGLVPILEYHLIGRPEGPWRRTPENFRRDLEMLYSLGYYPVRLLDYVRGRMDVPAGRSPVILTFDDSSAGQFRVLADRGKPRLDPECAVGMMEAFARLHPGFPARASFYVLPGIDRRLRLFGQPEFWGWKLDYLVKHGYELGNHTLWHQNLAKATPDEVRQQLAQAQEAVAAFVPGYQMRTMSLPFGAWPAQRDLAASGSYRGIAYRNQAILLVGAGPAPSPADKSYNPLSLPRIQAGDGPYGPEKTLRRLAARSPGRYISDGIPGVVAVPASLADRLRSGLKIRVVIVPDAQSSQAGTGDREAN